MSHLIIYLTIRYVYWLALVPIQYFIDEEVFQS